MRTGIYRAAAARLPNDLRSRADYQAQSDQLAQARLFDAFAQLPVEGWLYASGAASLAFLFAATDFRPLFFVLFWGAMVAWICIPRLRDDWARRQSANEDLGAPTARTRRWYAATGALEVLMTAAWVGFWVCLGAGLAALIGV
jgi:hypothetical protein